MAKTSKTKAVVDDNIADTAEKMNEETKKTTNKSVNKEPLNDLDEIEVVSLIPNVSYKDSKTGDMYEWDEVGHSEYMTFETLKNMNRGYKGYFRNMWLKPNDERVVKQFGLKPTFTKYEFLMDKSNYTRKNIDDICSTISSTPNGLKHSVCNKIKDMVVNGQVTDAFVIKKLEEHLNTDLIKFL